ncbi:hypothetical protein [Streptomyces exfoliatus]|nr:hypothetical protein [Streptomyces exfoliatus]
MTRRNALITGAGIVGCGRLRPAGGSWLSKYDNVVVTDTAAS